MRIIGGQPNKRTYEMLCFYLLGWATLEELEAHLEKKTEERLGALRANRNGCGRCCAEVVGGAGFALIAGE